MNVSIVIPVYNEALELDACLQAIAAQTVKPYEVIVVNNNSTDGTTVIAERYDFVTLLSEPRQGVVYARTLGFDAASGSILSRIDADSLLPADWVQSVQKLFADESLDATSGSAEYYDLAAAKFFGAGDVRLRRGLAKHLKDAQILWGANMAMRRSAWQAIRDQLCFETGIHEDFDIALHLQKRGLRVTFQEDLKVGVSCRRVAISYVEFIKYTLASPRTYARHSAGHQLLWYGVAALAAVTYVPWHIMHRGYDAKQKRFTLRQLLSERTRQARVDPTTNVA